MSLYDWLQRPDDREASAEPEPGATIDVGALEQRVVAALRTVHDPEIPVNIYDLGLIYEMTLSTAGAVSIRMTLTAPGCPVAQTFPGMVERVVRSVPGVTAAHVELVWDPPWSRDRMSEAARLELGMV
ncbi:MAG: SUF system Fe-S cluster assembly protein [Betaproteobacteria bacterium]|nr:MAG: SUF system Fe-S cluster assembly protein [Betaproteobacteria bacterium]